MVFEVSIIFALDKTTPFGFPVVPDVYNMTQVDSYVKALSRLFKVDFEAGPLFFPFSIIDTKECNFE